MFQPDKEAKVRPGGNFWALNAVYPRSLAPFWPPLSFVDGTMMLCVKDRRWGDLKVGSKLQGGDRLPSQWPELAFCNGQTFHSRRPTHPVYHCATHFDELDLLKKRTTQRCRADSAGIPSTSGTQDGQFPEFSQFFTKFFTKASRRYKLEKLEEEI